MTALEEITQAIEQLERLKADATLGPWTVEEIPETGECRVIREFEFFGSQVEEVTSSCGLRDDADLICVLHRTIDAQLAILRGDVEMHARYDVRGASDVWLDAMERAGDLALARAVNGETK